MFDTGGIDLVLDDLDELFVAPRCDPFAGRVEERSGVERLVADLRSRRGRDPVPVRIALPADAVTEDAAATIHDALVRYCEHRIATNRMGRQAARLDGWASSRIGLPIAVAGFLLVARSSAVTVGDQDIVHVLLEQLGWIVAWVGLWFPVDQLAFGPLAFGQQNRAWRRLRDAPITVVARPAPDPGVSARGATSR
jgi:hypothetical protein